ncbi:MAG: phage holin family protein [Candidatus Paceibacterota bacterium]
MFYLVARLLLSALALFLLAEFLPGLEVSSFYIALIVSVIFGVINILVKPILFILTLPITIVTLGLFSLVLNGLLFWFVASFVDGFAVSGFLSAFVASLLLSLLTGLLYKFLDKVNESGRRQPELHS